MNMSRLYRVEIHARHAQASAFCLPTPSTNPLTTKTYAAAPAVRPNCLTADDLAVMAFSRRRTLLGLRNANDGRKPSISAHCSWQMIAYPWILEATDRKAVEARPPLIAVTETSPAQNPSEPLSRSPSSFSTSIISNHSLLSGSSRRFVFAGIGRSGRIRISESDGASHQATFLNHCQRFDSRQHHYGPKTTTRQPRNSPFTLVEDVLRGFIQRRRAGVKSLRLSVRASMSIFPTLVPQPLTYPYVMQPVVGSHVKT
ncbi:hypothetical protein FA95DRAFT_1198215 [Auriscalpium vulgare]|uniref:Uncharacterized protein n=1 Tax=Auriscalpium vulgare TaxID=40419 RepID=A0ACB8RU22_9AGAM|nr:hypothetical protein FA95DRAFT_1198215 [Auriscalpium vulgare]